MAQSSLYLSPQGHRYNNITKIIKRKPDLIDMMSVLSEIRSEWATIGTSLNVPDQGLLHLNISDSGKLNATLQAWIDGYGKYSPVSWETVLEATGGPILNNESISEKIRRYLAEDRIFEKYILEDDFTVATNSRNNIMMILEAEPEIIDLMIVLVEVQSKWSTLGTALKVPEQRLPLHLFIPNGEKLKLTLQAWIDGRGKYSEVTWITIIAAVEGPIINNQRIAYEIRKHLGQDEIFEKYTYQIQSQPCITNDIRHIFRIEPELKDLMTVLAEIQSQWSTLGTALSVPEGQLPVNQQSVPDDVKLKTTLQAWIDTRSSPVNWETVIDAVRGPIINNERVAYKIRDHLSRDDVFEKYMNKGVSGTDSGGCNDVNRIIQTEPEMKDLMTVLAEIQSRWSTLGTALSVPEEKLPVNQQSVPDDVKLKRTLQAWIDTRSSPVTWRTVIDAVRGPIINNERVAYKILYYLGQDDVFEKYMEKRRETGYGRSNDIRQILDRTPDMIDLMIVLSQIESQYSMLGTALNIPFQGISNCATLNATLQLWLDGNGKYSPVTWRTVFEAVDGPIINNKRVLEEIVDYLSQDEIFKKYKAY